MDMQLGTAKITQETWNGMTVYVVRWMNHGNFLNNEPRGYNTRQSAENFCRDRSLRIVR
jgi:hypothetical protein